MERKWIQQDEFEEELFKFASVVAIATSMMLIVILLLLTGCATTSRITTPNGEVYTSQESTTFLGWGTDYAQEPVKKGS